jgi:glycosyltransferase involved in cell wall biosynthesis
MALVDIVMRTKNRPLFVRRALGDILAQEFTDWHLIIVNDGGDRAALDEVVADFADLDDRTTRVELAASVGRGAAVMHGVDAGGAPFVNWHDDDDTWHPQFLARTVAHLQATDDIAVDVRTDIVYERQIGDRLLETGREGFHALMQETTYFDLLRFNHVVPIAKLYRRSAHDVVGPTDARLHSVADWEFNMRLALAGTIGYIRDEVLAFWHQRPGVSGVTGNSVHNERASHHLHDRRVRDDHLRGQSDAGQLLYLSKFLDERTHELTGRLAGLEQGYHEILRRLSASR